MKEILAWGEAFPAQLNRLGIYAQQTYTGAGTVPSVYEFTDAAFETLGADSEENWEDMDAAWRYAQGCNLDLTYSQRTWMNVNSRDIKGWRRPDMLMNHKFDSLLQYMEEMGVTQPRNVAAVAAGLAELNRCSIGKLFTLYQPAPVAGTTQHDEVLTITIAARWPGKWIKMVHGILSLVDIDVPVEMLATWTKEQREAVVEWAVARHYALSDSDVDVPQRPPVLDAFVVQPAAQVEGS